MVAILSDGYENRLGGDLARVVASLPGAGIDTPVVFCHSKFTDKDALDLRCPAPALPQLEFWHESDFEGVVLGVFSAARGGNRDDCLREHLAARLKQKETEVKSWLVTS